MGLLNIRWNGLAAIVTTTLLAVGCASTRVNFRGPSGSMMYVDDKPYHLPATIDLARPLGSGGSQRHKVSLVAPLQSGELKTKGYIDVFGYAESDVDRMAVNTCILPEDQLARIFEGKTVIIRGQSASRQSLYELTLGAK